MIVWIGIVCSMAPIRKVVLSYVIDADVHMDIRTKKCLSYPVSTELSECLSEAKHNKLCISISFTIAWISAFNRESVFQTPLANLYPL